MQRLSLLNRDRVYVDAPVDMGTGPHQVLAATLTQFQPEGSDFAHLILMSPANFESHMPDEAVLKVS